MTSYPTPGSPYSAPIKEELTESQRQLLAWIQQQGKVSFSQVAEHLQQTQELVRQQLAELVQAGLVVIVEADTYCAQLEEELRASFPASIEPFAYSQSHRALAAGPELMKAAPAFSVSPESRPDRPIHLVPGTMQTLQVIVLNGSDRENEFCLTCPDLLSDWFTVTYPPKPAVTSEDNTGASGIWLAPGEQGMIILTLSPPTNALAGSYIPTLQLASCSSPDLRQMALIYLQIEPLYSLQLELQPTVNQVRRQSGRFRILIENQGNSCRNISLTAESLIQPDIYEYIFTPESVEVAPKAVSEVALDVTRRGRRRPWLGSGRQLNFRVGITDRDGHPLVGNSLTGSLTWLPQPWWQRFLLMLGGLGVLGGLTWLVWLWLRPSPQPQILEFFPEDAEYSAANNDAVELGWQIEDPERLETLEVAGYTPEGKLISGPLTFDFSAGIPPNLADDCVQEDSVLTCGNVTTDARLPGDYVFEMTARSKGGRSREPQQATSSQVTITPLPLPTVAELAPNQVIYAEAGTPPELTAVPPVGDQGIQLSWVVMTPQQLQDLLLIVRQEDGSVLGGRRFTLRNPENPTTLTLPPALEPFCQLSGALICQNVPSGIGGVGKYTFELAPVTVGNSEPGEGKTSELVKVLPRPVRIVNFRINGQEAQPKYLIPVKPGQPPPSFVVSWQVEGGATATAKLLPSPGTVPLTGSAPFPLSPEPGQTTLTLQVSNGSDGTIVRSVTIQTFDPTAGESAVTPAPSQNNRSPQLDSETDTPPKLEFAAPLDLERLRPPGESPEGEE